MKNKTVCLFGDGQIPKFAINLIKKNLVIGVDGGCNYLFDKNITPDVIIGDFDSIKAEILQKLTINKQTKILKIAEQETTDFEKTLYSINAKTYLCFGFWGDLIDHSLSVLHLLQKYSHKKIIIFSTENCCFILPKQGCLKIPKDITISIYPLIKTKFKTSSGLKYALNNLELSQGQLIGTRNKTNANKFSWQIESGLCLCIIPAKFYEILLTPKND